MSRQPRGGGGQLEDIPGEILAATSETRKALKAIQSDRNIPQATLLEHQASHALTLAAELSELEQFYVWSRPRDPAEIRRYMVDEMSVLWTVLEMVDGDVQRLYLSSKDHLQPEFPERWQDSVDRVIKSCRRGTNAVRAAWDALSPSETTPDRHEARAETRDKAVDALNELAKHLRALAKALSQTSALSRQSDSA
jgi:hypothetical protein